ncbi:MAG: tetratricopeptide repeat protein [Nitrospirales bacterium]|nr:tetratricopeptide repeat protein [Nitrospirales bacterium]
MFMNKHLGSYRTSFVRLIRGQWNIEAILFIVLFVTLSMNMLALAQEQPMNPVDRVADRAEAAWRDGDNARALDILAQGIRDNTHALILQKLRGNILATSRRPREAIEAYEAILQRSPEALDVRWSKWSVLLRMGEGDQAIAELQRIAQHDATNPLVYMRLAQELRKLDRLEESLEWYQKAVELAPDLPGWRLALARARFDVLDGRGARDEVQHVLKMVSPGSPEEAAARSLLSVVYGATKERGRRFEYIFSPEGTAETRKEWASIRADAWRTFEAGRYKEAEPLLRKVMDLKPSDYGATHDLGVTLMELGQYEEAMPILEKVLTMTTKDEVLADTFFWIGVCLAKLERWSEALVHFEILYDAAIEFEEMTKDVRVMEGIRVLDKEKLVKWKEMARQHVPESELKKHDANKRMLSVDPSSQAVMTEQELYEKIASKPMKSEDPIYTHATLMGRDADFSMFRYVIPAYHVMRDDLPGGAHEFIPIQPGNTFPPTQPEIYLVFGLVTASYDEVQLTAKCFLETSKVAENQIVSAQDQVVMAMNEQFGYFVLFPPETGWTPGLHRCGLFVGDEVSAYTHTDEVRFRIIDPTSLS